MDPLSVTASIVGLLAGAGKVVGVLHKVKNSMVDAPQSLGNLLTQVNELRTCLAGVYQLLSEMESAPSKRMSMIQVEQLVATLTDAVLTFSELEALIIPLGEPSEISIVERTRWAWKEETISSIMARLDRHKSSLSLMLIIVQCASDIQAENSRELLNDIIQQLLQSNQEILRRLYRMEVSYDSESVLTTCFRNNRGIEDDDSMTDTIVKGANSVQIGSNDSFAVLRTQESHFSFEVDLGSSRVYKRTQPYTSDVSFSSSAVRSHAWSIFSGLSLSQISNMSAIALPVHNDEIYDFQQYRIEIEETMVPCTLVADPYNTVRQAQQTDVDFFSSGGKNWEQELRFGMANLLPGSSGGTIEQFPKLAQSIGVPEIFVEGARGFASNEDFPPAFSEPSSPESNYSLSLEPSSLQEIDNSPLNLSNFTAVESASPGPTNKSISSESTSLSYSSADIPSSFSSGQEKYTKQPGAESREIDYISPRELPFTPIQVTHKLKAKSAVVSKIPISRSLNSLPLGKGRTSFKVVLLGDCCVGKSALAVQFCERHFVLDNHVTIQDSYQKAINIGGLSRTLHVLDSSGSEAFSALRKQEIVDGEGFLFVYSITDRASFENIQKLYNQVVQEKEWNGKWSEKYGLTSFHKPHPSPPIVLIANKSDDSISREVSKEEGLVMARRMNCKFWETSAKWNTNVEEGFNHVLLLLLEEKPTEKPNLESRPSVETLRADAKKGKLRQRIRIRWPSS